MARVDTMFIPAKQGFLFPNRFEIHLPVQFKLPLLGEIDLRSLVFGLCGGMCATALDYFHQGQPVPDTSQVETIHSRLLVYLCERQLDSLAIPVIIKFIEWMMLEDQEVAIRTARSEAPKVMRSLDSGKPVVLGLVRVQGIGNPTHNHQVLVTAYDYDPATKDLTLCLYDPNHPGEEAALHLNLAHPKTALNLVQNTGEALRGFFVVPYRPQSALPTLPQPMREAPPSFAGEVSLPFRLHWPVDSQRVNQFFGENPDTYKPFKLPGHEGIDLFALSGANVYAAADGEVYQADYPANHPYGRHVRIRHSAGGKTFHTIYGHLSELKVSAGQLVAAGDLIGLADNTGNSFGSHLHLTLKIEGESTSGYPAGIVDPWPYLKEALEGSDGPVGNLPPPSGLTVYTTAELKLRKGPGTDNLILTILPVGEPLEVLGNAEEVRPKIGAQGEWLQVITPGGAAGFVAAWYVTDSLQAFPPSDLVVYPIDTVNLRSGPGTAFTLLASLNQDAPLTVLGDAGIARAKVGRQGEWIQVQAETGQHGFVAAWLVHLTGQTPPDSGNCVYPVEYVNVRARPGTDANILCVARSEDALMVLGDGSQALAKVGRMGEWLQVRTPDRFAGFVAAWLVQQKPADTSPLPGPAAVEIYPTADVNIRAQPSLNSPRTSGASRGEKLTLIETDLEEARKKIGQKDQWVFVERANGARGWIAAWYLSLAPE